MSKHRKAFGQWGEDAAADYLIEKGYAIVARNYRSEYGEIDLVAERAQVLAFVEVKTRSSQNYGLPEEAITEQKAEHMLAAAQDYMQVHPEWGGDWRIDVIAVLKTTGQQEIEIVHFENALA